MASAAKNKWQKYRYLQKYKPLAPYIPETRIMSEQAFWELLAKYGHVMVKPIWGSRGRGVIQVSLTGVSRYELHNENNRTTLWREADVNNYIRGVMGTDEYMVQQRVERPKINGRPFDMRVIIQRKLHSPEWKVTGKVIKVAGEGYVVSNISRSNGKVLKFKPGIEQSSIRHLSARQLESEIDRIALLSAKRLSSYFPGHRIYGLDIGLDTNGHIWIIEANLYPSRSHFLKLKDKTMYYRIIRYKNG